MANKNLFLGRGPSKPDVKRTLFDLSYKSHVSFKEGLVYPCYLQEVPANSTLTIQPTFSFDFMPMVFPIQNNVKMHMSFYKVPWRILWKNFPDWYSGIGDHPFPIIGRPASAFKTGGVLDYLGVPTVVAHQSTIERGFNRNNGAFINGFCIDFPNFTGNPFRVNSFSDLQTVQGYADSASNAIYCPICNDQLADGLITFRCFDNQNSILLNRAVTICVGYSSSSINHGSGYEVTPLYQFVLQAQSGSSKPAPGQAVYTSNNNSINVGTHAGSTNNYIRDIFCQLPDSAIDTFNDLALKADVRIIIQSNIPSADVELPERFNVQDTSLLQQKNQVYSVVSTSLYSSYGLIPSVRYKVSLSMSDNDEDNNFALQDGAEPNIPISVLPLRAYDFLRNYVFRNQMIDPFILNGQPSYNKFLTNDDDGLDTTTPTDFIRAPYEFDMFTTCLKTPQLGHAPLIGISVNDTSDLVSMTFQPSEGDQYTVGVQIGEDGNAIGISNYEDVADLPNVHRLEEFIAAGISYNDIRNVSCYQSFLERMQNTSLLYENVIQEFFGVRPPTGDHYPEFLGGVTRDVFVSKIQNMAQSDGNALGEFAGTANVSGQGHNIEVFCSEQSYVIGVIWFTVTPVYSQKLDRHWQKFHRLDLFNPQFAHIGPQPVFKSQINPLALRKGHYNDLFGYNRAFVDLISRQDEVHAQFRTTMFNFIQQRFFINAPDLGREFIYMDPDELADVFAVSSDSDKIFGIINFDVLGELPIPRMAIPSIVG